jgi:hypothetical protein
MVIFEDDDDLTLHELLKTADRKLRNAQDDLEACRFAYRESASDRNRVKVKEAKVKVNFASDERDELFNKIAEEEALEDSDCAW